MVGLNWWQGDDQFPLAIHNCILHAIGLNRRGGADSHVRFDWRKLGEMQNSVFLICEGFDIPVEAKQEVIENGGLEDNEHVRAYFCLAKIFSLAMSSINYRFDDKG